MMNELLVIDPCVCAKISGIVTAQKFQVLPVHIILGNNECCRITTTEPQRAGREWDPVLCLVNKSTPATHSSLKRQA